MGDSEKPRTLLAHLSWRFHPRMEEVAVEALTYILNRYPASREGLAELVERPVPDMRLSAKPFETEAVAPDGTRPDMLQRGDDESERLFIEAKFDAPLTGNQPVAYLKRLPAEGVSALMFLAPAERVDELWPELLGRLANSDMPYSDKGSRCVAIEGTEKHLLITHWTKLLDNMEERLKDSESGLAELNQLRGLVQFTKAGEEKASLPGKELVNRVTEIGKASEWLDTRGLRATARSYGYGRYVNLGHRYKLCVWMGVNLDLFEEFASTRLWVHCDNWSDADSRRWNERVRPALKDRMSPHVHEEGEALWVAVVPEGRTRADDYAAALVRIAGILDELAEPWGSRADALAEVSRRYEQPVMGNAHRAEYVEALLALALGDGGWTRKEPSEAWHFENESGVQLKLKQAAAMQSSGNGETQSSPRFDIDPGRVYRDEKKRRCVEHRSRLAHIYVFAWHGGTGESADQGDPTSWEFYVVPESGLPDQKRIAMKELRGLTSPCGIEGLAAAVDAISESVGATVPQPAESPEQPPRRPREQPP